MSGKKPPRPHVQPVVPRQRRETAPADLEAVTPPPRPPAPPPAAEEPGEPRVLALVLGAMVALALVAVAVFLVLRDDGPAPSATREADPAPEPPVTLAARTSYVDTRVTPGGDLVVRQWLHGRSQMFGVELAPPPSVGALRVTDVVVLAGGRAAPGPDRLRRGRGSFAFTGSEDVYLSYRVQGAVERSDSAPGRALARLTSLEAQVTPGMVATTHAVRGGRVLALACASRDPGAVPVPCGAPAGRGWRVERAGAARDDVVIAQLDLP